MGRTVVDDISKGRVIWVALAVGLLSLLYILSSVAAPFLVGLGLAYLFHPLVDTLEGRLVPRWLSSFILVLALSVLFFTFWLVLLPILGEQLETLLYKMPGYTRDVLDYLRPHVDFLTEKMNAAPLFERTELVAPEALQKGFLWLTNQVLLFLWNAQGIGRLLFFMLVTPFVMFYGLLEWHDIMIKTFALVPLKVQPRWESFFVRFDHTISGYIRGQMLVCLCMSVYLSLGFGLIGLPHGFLLGTLTGFLIFIPYVGMIIGTFFAIVLTLVNIPSLWSFFCLTLVLVGGQLLEALVLIPLFIGPRVGIHPVWVLFAIFASAMLFGFWGILLALPIATFCHGLIKETLTFYRTTAFYKRQPR